MTREADYQFLKYVLEAILDHPEDIKIDRKIDDLGILLELTVHKEDVGKVIGKGGQTLKSLRVLLRLIGSKNDGQRINLRLLETDGN